MDGFYDENEHKIVATFLDGVNYLPIAEVSLSIRKCFGKWPKFRVVTSLENVEKVGEIAKLGKPRVM